MASLNKDLFGKIPVTPVTTTPVRLKKNPKTNKKYKKKEEPRHVNYDADVYHGSQRSVDDFTKAPIIHVGSAEQAAHVANSRWDLGGKYDHPAEVENVHGFEFSEHVKIHPPVFPDAIANEAHARFLEERGHAIPLSVSDSRIGRQYTSPLIDNALRALNENRVIKYDNVAEGKNPYIQNTDLNVSYMVPTPSLNLKQFGEKEKWEQQPLPMDYTDTVPQSNATGETRAPKGQRRYWEHPVVNMRPQ